MLHAFVTGAVWSLHCLLVDMNLLFKKKIIACLFPSLDHERMGRGRQPIKKPAQVRATGPE